MEPARCDIDGVTRTGELAGVSESSRDIDGQTREGERAGAERVNEMSDPAAAISSCA
jgi:hypothetical protein